MLQIKNVSKQFKNIVVFKDLNLTFKDGKKYLIKGANGSGKSVLLKLLVGYSKPSKGNIIFENYELGKDYDFLLNSGVSIDYPEFIENFTGLENLLYIAKIKKIANKEKILNLAYKFNFIEEINKKYKTYSQGMKQKLRIIQAVMDDPKYLILDEPFNAIDEKSKAVIFEFLNNYIDKSRMLIYTSHNAEDELLADYIYECKNNNLNRCDKELNK